MQQNSFEHIPDSFLDKWQGIADLIANVIKVPAALIMKVENEFMEVFITSETENNPYNIGDKENWHGLYCETVIKTQKKLRVPNALKDKDWDKNPDIKLGMIAYLGFPINFPDKTPFGTLCVLDNKERQFSADNERLLLQFKKAIELDLALIFSLKLKQDSSNKTVIQQLIGSNEEYQAMNEEYLATNEELKQSYDELSEAKKIAEENEQRFRLMYENTSMGMAVISLDFKIDAANDAYCEMLGYTEEELIGKTLKDITSPEDVNDNLDLQTQLKQGRINAYQIEKRFIHKDGHLVYGLLNATLVKNAQNEALYFLGNVQNITERKKAEEALQEKNDLLERVFDSNFDLVALTDLEGKYTLVGKSHEILGYGKDYLIGKNVLSFVHPDDINRVSKEFVHFFKTGENRKAEYRYKCIDGEYLWFETVGTLLKDEKGNPEQILFNTRNVTERKKAEETLRESRELLNVTQQIAKIGGWVYDKKNKSMTWADETYRIHGMDPNEFTPGTPDHIEHSIACYNKEDRATIESAFNRCVEDGTPYSFEFLITTVQRQKKWILTSAQADLENGKVIKVYGHIMDITERKQAEKALQENEEKMRSIYRVAPTGIGLVVNRVLKDVNPRVCEMTGYTRETLLEKNARILYPSQEEYEFIGEEKYKQIRKTGTGKVETVWQKKDGTIINVLLASTPIDKNDYSKGVIFTALDITERKQAEKALVESEEMMRSSQAVAHIGSYSTNLNRNEIEKSQWVCSPELYNVCGIDENYPHTIAAWADFIHPDYREEVFAYHESVVKEKKSFNREYKIIRINDGVERWVHGTGELVYDDQGNPVRIYGAIQDITERKIIENGYVLL